MSKHDRLFAVLLTAVALLIAQPAQAAGDYTDLNSDPIVDVYPNSEADEDVGKVKPTDNIEPMVDIYPDQEEQIKYSNTDRGAMQNYNNAESQGSLKGKSSVFERKEKTSGSGSKWRVM